VRRTPIRSDRQLRCLPSGPLKDWAASWSIGLFRDSGFPARSPASFAVRDGHLNLPRHVHNLLRSVLHRFSIPCALHTKLFHHHWSRVLCGRPPSANGECGTRRSSTLRQGHLYILGVIPKISCWLCWGCVEPGRGSRRREGRK